MKQLFFISLFLLLAFQSQAQNLYKTPSGKKYHLATCRMVKNVSAKVSPEQIRDLGLTPCKICKPNAIHGINSFYTSKTPAGKTRQSVQCKGRTKRCTRCKHRTHIANGYCYQHQAQAKK